jgi:hypothetical protein
MPVGAPVAVERGSGRETGTFAGLDEEGAMLFASDAGGIVRVTFGDVTILAAPPRAAEDGGRG